MVVDEILRATTHDLSAADWARWDLLQTADLRFDSAFFRPELARLVGGIRAVEVAVLKSQGETVGLWPYQRGSGGVAQALLGRLSEFHGVIGVPQLALDPRLLLRQLQLKAWRFDHVPASHTDFEQYAWSKSESPYVDLASGYDAYREAQRKSGSNLIKNLERKARKLEREVGELRFAWHSTDDVAFEKLIEWKSDQHRRTGLLEVLNYPWVREVTQALRTCDSPRFAGVLSTLHAGEELVAVHLGLCSDRALHVWFPAYNTEFGHHSPGGIFMLELARATAERGRVRVDFGKGAERYKQSLSSGSIELLDGTIDRRPLVRAVRRGWHNAKQAIRSSPYREKLEAPLNLTRKLRQRFAFR